MRKRSYLAVILLLSVLAVLAAISAAAAPAVAAPTPLSATFSKVETECGILWPAWDFTWEYDDGAGGPWVWIDGEGSTIRNHTGGETRKCSFTLDLSRPELLSRAKFCADPVFSFMCKGNGALLDNRTTCNIQDREVHNGIVQAAPSGKGMFVCHVK
jgi:hypothetical protein